MQKIRKARLKWKKIQLMHFIRKHCIKRDHLNNSSDLWREKNWLFLFLCLPWAKQVSRVWPSPGSFLPSVWDDIIYKGASFTELKERPASKWKVFPNRDAMLQSTLLMNMSHLCYCVTLPQFLGPGSRVVQSKECHLLIKLFTTLAISWSLIRRFLYSNCPSPGVMNLYFRLLWLYWHIRWWCWDLVRIPFHSWDLCFDWWCSVSWFLTESIPEYYLHSQPLRSISEVTLIWHRSIVKAN